MLKNLMVGLVSSAILLTGCAAGPGHTRAAGTLGGALAGAAIGSRTCGGTLAGAVVGMVAGTMAGDAIAQDQERAMYGPPPPPTVYVQQAPPPPQTVIVYEEAPPPPPGVIWVQGPGYRSYWHPVHHRYYYCR